MKTMPVITQKSTLCRKVENPPSKTTVAHMKAIVPTPVARICTKTSDTKQMLSRCSGPGSSEVSPLLARSRSSPRAPCSCRDSLKAPIAELPIITTHSIFSSSFAHSCRAPGFPSGLGWRWSTLTVWKTAGASVSRRKELLLSRNQRAQLALVLWELLRWSSFPHLHDN